MKPASHYRRVARLGPGGLKCRCCGPKPGRDRRQLRRTVRARLRAEARAEIIEALEDLDPDGHLLP